MSVKTEINIKAEINVRVEDNIKAQINVRAEDDIKAEINVRAEDDIKAEINVRAEDDIKAEINVRAENNVKAEGSVNVSNPKINKLYFFIEELMAFFAQVLIFFCVAMLLSNWSSNEADLIRFLESKFFSPKEFFFTLIATIIVLGLLVIIQKFLSGIESMSLFFNKIIDNTLLEFPRTLYLFGSSLVAVTLSVGIYINRNSGSGDISISYFVYAILFAIIFFLYGCIVKYLLIRNTLKK